MTTESEAWPRVRAAFEKLVDLPIGERPAALAKLSAQVRAGVERLLSSDERLSEDFLNPPDEGGGIAPRLGRLGEAVGTRIADYEVEACLAIGGMGAVYVARQRHPDRKVALKLLEGTHATRVLQRFQDEIGLLARMRHPGIAQIFEAGTLTPEADGVRQETPWFSMELVEDARDLLRHCRDNALGLDAKLGLFHDVCAAVHHGHQRGVLHRDLKPANVLVDAAGHVKVIDFGIAKATDDPLGRGRDRTLHGELVGTLRYMSPEQLQESDAVDVRSDVYALGVLLFELLTDRPPLELDTVPVTEAWRRIRDVDPPTVDALDPRLSRELGWIVAKCLAKEPERRYASAHELALDLERLRRHEPVVAGPPSRAYAMRKFVRRHRVGVVAAGLVLLAILGGWIGTSVGLVRARRAESEARIERERAELEATSSANMLDFLVEVLSSPNPAIEGRDVRVADALVAAGASYHERFASSPRIQAELARTLGIVYEGLGLHEDAARFLQESLDVLRARERTSPEELVAGLSNIAVVQIDGGLYEAAQESLAEALSLAPQGSEPAFMALALQGRLELSRADVHQAVATLEEALSGLTRTAGPQAGPTLLAKNDLAVALHQTSRFDEAEVLYREALAGLDGQPGKHGLEAHLIRFNLAMLQHTRGAVDAPIAELEDILAIRRERLGPDHPETTTVVANLGAMLLMAGRPEDARPYLSEQFERTKDKLPPEHPVLQTLRNNLGMLERQLGNYERAEEHLQAVHTTRVATNGAGHVRTLMTLFNLADLAREAGWQEEAEERATRGFEASYQNLPEDHPFAFEFLRFLGELYTQQGRYEEAETMLLESVELFGGLSTKPDNGPPHPQLVALYEAWGRPDEAALWQSP